MRTANIFHALSILDGHRRCSLRRLLVIAAVIALPPLAHANPLAPPGPPGPTFKNLGDIEPRTVLRASDEVVEPLVIDQSGSYYLTQNVIAIPDNPAIRITASNVTLDLNGFTVSGNQEVQDGDGIRIEGAQVTVRNGTVRGADGDGISCPNGGPIALINVNAVANADTGAVCSAMRVNGGEFSDNGVNGVGGTKALITGVRAVGNGNVGISVSTGGSISNSLSIGNDVGIVCQPGPSLVTQSISRDNVSFDRLGNCSIFDSVVP